MLALPVTVSLGAHAEQEPGLDNSGSRDQEYNIAANSLFLLVRQTLRETLIGIISVQATSQKTILVHIWWFITKYLYVSVSYLVPDCWSDPLIGLMTLLLAAPSTAPAWHPGDAVNLSQTSQLRPTSITHSLLGLHSIVTPSTIVFTNSQFPDPASPDSHTRRHNDSLIRSLSHPPRNTISPKIGNYS